MKKSSLASDFLFAFCQFEEPFAAIKRTANQLVAKTNVGMEKMTVQRLLGVLETAASSFNPNEFEIVLAQFAAALSELGGKCGKQGATDLSYIIGYIWARLLQEANNRKYVAFNQHILFITC